MARNPLNKGQAIVILGLVLLLMIFITVIPLLLTVGLNPVYSKQSTLSYSQLLSQKNLQLLEIEEGNPEITVSTQGDAVYLNFNYFGQITPITIDHILYYSNGQWKPAYPSNITVSGDTTLSLYVPPGYQGFIDIVTDLGNSLYLPVSTAGGLTTCANIYNVSSGEVYLGTKQLPVGTIIITPQPNQLPNLVHGIDATLPKGTIIIEKNGTEIKLPARQELNTINGVVIQKCFTSGWYPISNFLTAYQSDNNYTGTVISPNSPNNPSLQSQTLVQWFIASGNIEPIVINVTNNPQPPSNNVNYLSNTPPEGGYIVWSGDAGLIVGSGLKVGNGQNGGNTGNSNPYYLAFTVQLKNGSWETIVDPKPIGQGQESPLTLAVGSYDEGSGTMSLYINDTLVSTVKLGSLQLNNTLSAFMDAGSASNSTSTSTTGYLNGIEGNVNTAGSPQYSFNGILGPTIIYDVSLPGSEIQEIYQGKIPSSQDVVVLWSQNMVLQIGGAYKVPNLADPGLFDGYWGLGAGIPTAFSPFSDIIIWGGGAPVILNPNILLNSNQQINITIESQGLLTPIVPGYYKFVVNFSDPINTGPGGTPPGPGGTPEYVTPEYVTVYINGEKIYEGTNENQGSINTFNYYLSQPVNITTYFTFTLASNQQNPEIYFNLMWMPPGSTSFEPIPLSSLTPFFE